LSGIHQSWPGFPGDTASQKCVPSMATLEVEPCRNFVDRIEWSLSSSLPRSRV
jgi:hypothetical protein